MFIWPKYWVRIRWKLTSREVGNICRHSTRNAQIWKSSPYNSTREIQMHATCFCCFVSNSRFLSWTRILSWRHARNPCKFIILQNKCTLEEYTWIQYINIIQPRKLLLVAWFGLWSVELTLWFIFRLYICFLKSSNQKISIYEFDYLQVITETWSLHHVPDK